MRKLRATRRLSARPSGFTVTVAALAARLERDHGRPPTDEELAALLAVSLVRTARHRALIERGRK